ncbi:MAG: hypothetical protein HGA33_05575, partial [Candidatus Moranbacteria bacterium]|nr:hypothetical protein [Candidatus Moranbacteria bacterium]
MTFFLFLVATLAIPLSGYLLLRGLFGPTLPLSSIESSAFSLALGIGSLDFSMIALGKAGIALSGPIVLIALFAFPVLSFALRFAYERLTRKRSGQNRSYSPRTALTPPTRTLLLLLVGLAVFLKVIFLVDAGLPTATDLGHHMYWSKIVVDTERLPEYSKREIVDTG